MDVEQTLHEKYVNFLVAKTTLPTIPGAHVGYEMTVTLNSHLKSANGITVPSNSLLRVLLISDYNLQGEAAGDSCIFRMRFSSENELWTICIHTDIKSNCLTPAHKFLSGWLATQVSDYPGPEISALLLTSNIVVAGKNSTNFS